MLININDTQNKNNMSWKFIIARHPKVSSFRQSYKHPVRQVGQPGSVDETPSSAWALPCISCPWTKNTVKKKEKKNIWDCWKW